MKTECPKCETMNRIIYPDGFYYNRAEYGCTNCGLKEISSCLDDETALKKLMEILSDIKKKRELKNE